MSNARETIGFRIDPEMKAELEALATAQYTSTSTVIRQALAAYLANKGREDG